MDSFVTAEGFEKTFRYAKLIKQGLAVTVMLAACTVVIGFILGIILALMRMSDIRPLRFLAYDRQGRLTHNKTLITLSKLLFLSLETLSLIHWVVKL